MSNQIERFEVELKSKISHKSSSFQSEEGFLIKQFKFFDIYNSGSLNFDNFYRTVEKIGIIKDKEEVREFFEHLAGVDAAGNINYREYATNLYSGSKLPSKAADEGITYSPSKKGTLDEREDQGEQYNFLRSGMNSRDYPLATTTQFYKPAASAGRKNVMNPDYINQQ
jgi:hypothetical protein